MSTTDTQNVQVWVNNSEFYSRLLAALTVSDGSGETDQYLAVPEPHKSVEIFLCYMSRLLICGSTWHTETRLFRGLTALLWDWKSVYQPGPVRLSRCLLLFTSDFSGSPSCVLARSQMMNNFTFTQQNSSPRISAAVPPLWFNLSVFPPYSLFYNRLFYLLVPSPLPLFYFCHLCLVTQFVKQFSGYCVHFFLIPLIYIKDHIGNKNPCMSKSWLGFTLVRFSYHNHEPPQWPRG